MRALLDFCESHRDWIVETTAALARTESPSTDRQALLECAADMAQRLTDVGARVTRLPRETAGDHLLAEVGCGERQLLVLGHYDTVWPVGQIQRMPIELRDGKLFGPGVYDMKGGLAVGLLALRALQQVGQLPFHRIVFLVTSDEEIGSHTSRAAIEDEAKRSDAVFVLEPALPDGRVKTFRKGVGVYSVAAHGVSAHAGGAPASGASAIHELAQQIVAIAGLQDVGRGLTVNIGRIEGGTIFNVVAEYAAAEVDVRISSVADAPGVERFMRSLAPRVRGTRLEVQGGINRLPFERTAAVVALFETARDVAAELGFELAEGGTGGASDGNFTGALGIPTLDGLGAVGDGAHALHEHVVVDELPRRAALLAGLLLRAGRN